VPAPVKRRHRLAERVSLDPHHAAVAALTGALGGFLVARIHAWPPNEDEALAFFVSGRPLPELLQTVVQERGGAPLHFLLTHLAGVVSPGLTSLRLVSVACAVASVPAIAALVGRLAGRRVGLVATILVATSWMLLFHGVFGRMYALFLLTSTLSFLALLGALERGDRLRWAAWVIATLAVVASHPFGAFVLATQAGFVLVRWRRERVSPLTAGVSLLAVAVLATPLWLGYARLSERYRSAPDEDRGGLGPTELARYVRRVLGDFSVGWTPGFLLLVAAAGLGLAVLARTRPRAAVLAAIVVPLAAFDLIVGRVFGTTQAGTRHLIFALPFFAMLVAAGLLRAVPPRAFAVALAALVSAQLAWAWAVTPALFAEEDPVRAAARARAADWLAARARSDDVLFAFDPLYLGAWERGAPYEDATLVPRIDPGLMSSTLEDEGQELGRGVWVLDASSPDDSSERLSIAERSPGPEFEARAFGPFLVVRTIAPVDSPAEFLDYTVRVERLGEELDVASAHDTRLAVEAALARVRGS
jgi:dolichyl-phosphate-mannose-protein mannosyltransferase